MYKMNRLKVSVRTYSKQFFNTYLQSIYKILFNKITGKYFLSWYAFKGKKSILII